MNKEKRAQRHAMLLSKQAASKDKRLTMLTKIKAMYPEKTNRALRKMFGTLSIHRMEDILNDSYQNSNWYKNHQAIKEARRLARQVNHARFKSIRRNKQSKVRNRISIKIQEVPNGSNAGSR